MPKVKRPNPMSPKAGVKAGKRYGKGGKMSGKKC
jgi:hypothetical protein